MSAHWAWRGCMAGCDPGSCLRPLAWTLRWSKTRGGMRKPVESALASWRPAASVRIRCVESGDSPLFASQALLRRFVRFVRISIWPHRALPLRETPIWPAASFLRSSRGPTLHGARTRRLSRASTGGHGAGFDAEACRSVTCRGCRRCSSEPGRANTSRVAVQSFLLTISPLSRKRSRSKPTCRSPVSASRTPSP